METPWVHDIIYHTITNFNYLRDIRGLTLTFFCFSFSFATTTALTSISAIAEGPLNALSHLKSCQLLHNCTKNHI